MLRHSDEDKDDICIEMREIEFMEENGVRPEGTGFIHRDSRIPDTGNSFFYFRGLTYAEISPAPFSLFPLLETQLGSEGVGTGLLPSTQRVARRWIIRFAITPASNLQAGDSPAYDDSRSLSSLSQKSPRDSFSVSRESEEEN